MLKIRGKRGQVAVFVIIAVVIIAIIGLYLYIRSGPIAQTIPSDLMPVYTYYQSCIQNQAQLAIELAGVQGGHIYINNYDPASDYAPFSSQLNFLGFPIPYWYYVSGNGLVKEQVPTKADIESDISKYVQTGLNNCNFDQFYSEGYSISFGNPVVSTTINDGDVLVDVENNINVSRGNSSALQMDRSVDIPSKLGEFYNIALQIYNYEQSTEFLENYSVDVLRLYAPVDGVAIGCSPQVWKTPDVVNQLEQALESNIGAIKFQGGNYYSIKNSTDKYFVVNQPVSSDASVNLLYSPNWSTKIDVSGQGVDSNLMIANVVGDQPGLGMMGFCYAPYHFVYDIDYPVVVQIYDDNEMFQFPMAVVIDKNLPRQGDYTDVSTDNVSVDLCSLKTQNIQVSTYDDQVNPIDAEISYQCFDQKCDLGSTVNGTFTGMAPACLNGYLYADADNYTEAVQLFSSNNQTSTSMILNKEYTDQIGISVGGAPLNGQAIVMFDGATTSASATLPDVSNVTLSQGMYNVTVYVYDNSSLVLPASTSTQCTQVPQSGILGFFGGTTQQCYSVPIPETNITYALVGGGQSQVYLLESDLQSGQLNISVDKFNTPNSLTDLENNYEEFSGSGVIIS